MLGCQLHSNLTHRKQYLDPFIFAGGTIRKTHFLVICRRCIQHPCLFRPCDFSHTAWFTTCRSCPKSTTSLPAARNGLESSRFSKPQHQTNVGDLFVSTDGLPRFRLLFQASDVQPMPSLPSAFQPRMIQHCGFPDSANPTCCCTPTLVFARSPNEMDCHANT